MNKKRATIIGGVIGLFLTVSLLSYIYATIKKWNGVMLPGTKIESLDVTGKTKEQTLEIINKKYKSAIENQKLIVTAPNKKYELKYSNMKAKYNIDETINEAFKYCRNMNVFTKFAHIKNPTIREFKFKFSYEPKVLDNFIKSIEQDINKEPKNATIQILGGGSFDVTPEQTGVKLKTEQLKKELTAKLNKSDINSAIEVEAPLEIVNARITKDKLSKINALISSFSTNYSSSSYERANNIELATKTINGTILMPGDTFSFDKIVGERTQERGYKRAGVIIGNKVEAGFGGGICQVSSTLYNAMLRANIDPTERAHHTLPSSYVPLGLDATIDYGNIDYKFVNTLKYPIYIEGSACNGNLSFNIYSNSTLTGTTCEIISNVYQTIQPKVRYVDDPSKPKGYTEVTQNPSTGYRVKVYKKIYNNGQFIKKQLVSDDFYQPVDSVVVRGTK